MSETTMDDLERKAVNKMRGRRSHTLAQWWDDLNCWRWPNGLPFPEESPEVKGTPLRSMLMNVIAREVGFRTIAEFRKHGRKS